MKIAGGSGIAQRPPGPVEVLQELTGTEADRFNFATDDSNLGIALIHDTFTPDTDVIITALKFRLSSGDPQPLRAYIWASDGGMPGDTLGRSVSITPTLPGHIDYIFACPSVPIPEGQEVLIGLVAESESGTTMQLWGDILLVTPTGATAPGANGPWTTITPDADNTRPYYTIYGQTLP